MLVVGSDGGCVLFDVMVCLGFICLVVIVFLLDICVLLVVWCCDC